MVADVGGTNTRVALFDPADDGFRALRTYVNRDYPRLEDILAQWRATLEEPAPDTCCMAVAAPPSEDLVVMSNMDWSFSCRELAGRLGLGVLHRLNDFEANAYALPRLKGSEREQLYPGIGDPSGRLAVAGPGTGLGGAFLDWFDRTPRSFACEPGQMGLTPANDLELDIFRLLLPRHGNIYAELLVSGPGLARLHQALGEITGARTENLTPEDISALALQGRDQLCVLTLRTFCALLGSACGNFLLANGSYGGLYLAGGIVRELAAFVRGSEFHQRMVEKGSMTANLARVPVYLVATDQPGLIGAAHAPLP
jgi:glucokinase